MSESSNTQRVTFRQTVVLPMPVLDDLGEPTKIVKKYRGRDVEVLDYEHIMHAAGDIVSLPDEIGRDMVRQGYATEFDEALDA